VNRTTAKATLTQVLSYVFQRMESTDAMLKEKSGESTDAMLKSRTHNGKSSSSEGALPLTVSGEGGVEGAVELKEPTTSTAIEAEEVASGAVSDIKSTELALTTGGDLADNASNDGIDDNATEGGGGGDWPSLDHKNAWLLFRALCKLSMKDSLNRTSKDAPAAAAGNGAAATASEVPLTVYDPIAVQSKALSLELLLWVLKYSGPCFRSNARFIHSVRSYLCVSLLRNCTSAVPEIVGLSLQVFVQLHTHFNHHLKHEVEVFISKIFLPILDSENSTPYHKELVLDVLFTMCADPSTINDIFRNYDADFESADLFQQMVDSLARCGKIFFFFLFSFFS
jgi:brefeldin A-inhibited guanine nucleotide-exchange protein